MYILISLPPRELFVQAHFQQDCPNTTHNITLTCLVRKKVLDIKKGMTICQHVSPTFDTCC